MNLLNYVPGNSFLHKLNPVTKLVAAFMYGIAAIICNNVYAEVGFIVLMILISATAGIAKRAIYLTRNLMILGLIMFIIQLFFVRSGDPLLVIGGAVLFTTGGLKSALLLSLRVIAAMLPLMLLFAITQMNDLCNAMVKRLHLPYRYAFIVTTAFRFVPIFATEFHDIQDAQKARGVDFDTKNIIRKLKLIAPLCVPLLVSSLKKVDISAMSAEMRGFELRGYESGYKQYPFGIRDLITIIVLVVLIVVSVMFLR
ncbi:MAG: energy-coupling factor transporter transmembrane protein EcfT [Butyrivibrio sp.]|uniref:energy-coupling factor transporter transmembrane component T family protein n=1 Tax=Butyrivibrio sp. TaxID=28121 RepID=UPI0025E6C308|nr:energy-coupling factor transporter transmembrane component T [Butyrivibrio sp.]MCR5771725.1 energy-coupling factor transporter transmembrane protein EcfT [Butyrivibrio sp.]